MNFRTFASGLSILPIFLLGCTIDMGKSQPNESVKTSPLIFTDGPTPTTTRDVPTSDLFPSMTAAASDQGIEVWAALIYPAGNFLALGPGDSLTATAGSKSLVMTPEARSDGEVHYIAQFPADTSVSQITIAFQRGGSYVSAPNNVLPLAASFEVAGPSTAVSSAPLVLTVAPAPAAAELQFYGECVPDQTRAYDVAPDTKGRVSFDLRAALDAAATECALSVRVMESSQGTWDPAFFTDSTADVFGGLQIREVPVTFNGAPIAP